MTTPRGHHHDLLLAAAQVLLSGARLGRNASSQDICSALNLLLFASHECHLVAFVRPAAAHGVRVLGSSRIDPMGAANHCSIPLDELRAAVDMGGAPCPTSAYDLVAMALGSRGNPDTFMIFGMLAPSACEQRLGQMRDLAQLTSIYLDQYRLILAEDPAALHNLGNPELTSRQRRVVELMAQGMTNDQIAHRIAYSPSLVRHEGQAIFRILGVSDRRSAVERAIDLGLIERMADANGLRAS